MMTRRLTQLQLGLILYGFSMALMIRANLGLNPWEVFHQGVAERTGWSFGTVVIVTGALVLLLWAPLRQKPGVGTLSNIFVIGLAADASLALVPEGLPLPVRISFLLGGIVLNGVAGGAYIGAGLGPGPRDGLMTGLAARTGRPIRIVRTGIEAIVLTAGWVMGGTVGLGTILYAVAIGPIVQFMLPIFTVRPHAQAAVAAE